MKKINLLATAAIFAVTAFNANAAEKATSKADGMFIEKASIGGNFEVESSKLALEKSQNASVKSFAQEMIDDHTKANDELKQVVSDDNLDSSKLKDGLDAKHQAIVDKLNSTPAEGFDAAYVKAQKDAHVETIALFKTEIAKGNDKGLKKFAVKTLPTLKGHAAHVAELKASM